MKILFKRSYLILVITSSLVLLSCEKKTEPVIYNHEYLHEYSLVSSTGMAEAKQKLLLASFLYPELASVAAEVSSGVEVYKVVYNTYFQTELVRASGLVCIPKEKATYPLMSFQNGTNTCHEKAPSENNSDTLFTLLSTMSATGYIITIPDYIGFGESDGYLHPYHHKASSNSAVIDLLKASEELLEILDYGVDASQDIYLLGYSQGGWATMAVLDELENGDYTYNVIAAACGAGAYNLTAMSEYVLGLEEYGNPFYLPYFIESRRQNGILSNALSDFFNEPYITAIPAWFDGSVCNSAMNDQFSQKLSDLVNANMLNNFSSNDMFAQLRSELSNNSVDGWNLSAKLRIYHSSGDKSVPAFLSEDIYNDFLAKGTAEVNIEFIEADILDHNQAVLPWGIDAISWINGLK